MYRVIREFYDLQDAVSTKGGTIYHHYLAGDVYPREGLDPSRGRVEELLGADNAQGTALIEPIAGKKMEAVSEEPVPDFMPAPEEAVEEAPEVKKPRAKRAKK